MSGVGACAGRSVEPAMPTQPTGKSGAPAKAGVSKSFRRLKWNELVSQGDFVEDKFQRLELWDGPGGFRADAFMKPIYRRKEAKRLGLTATRKSKREK
jgi:hypothetical protein